MDLKSVVIGVIAGVVVSYIISQLLIVVGIGAISFLGIIIGASIAGKLSKGNKRDAIITGALTGLVFGIISGYLLSSAYNTISAIPAGNYTFPNGTNANAYLAHSSQSTSTLIIAGSIILNLILGAIGGLIGYSFFKGNSTPIVPKT